MSHAAASHQQHDYRAYSHSGAPAKRPPPVDGEEQWYLDGGASNRMALALVSGIPKEVDWALSRLVNLSDEHTNRFVLSAVPRLSEAILYWPEVYIEESRKKLTQLYPYFAPGPRVEGLRKHAIESLLTLRNASHNDLNANHLGQEPRTMRVIVGMLHLPPDEVNTELLIYALELLTVIGPYLPSVSKTRGRGTSPYVDIPFSRIDEIVSTSIDRALIIPAMGFLTPLMVPNPAIPPESADYYPPPYSPSLSSLALSRALRFLAVLQDAALVTAALEFVSTYLSTPSTSKAFLAHPDFPNTLRLLISILRNEQKVETKVVALNTPKSKAEPEEQYEPYELTEEDLSRIVPMSEPERSVAWMRIMFEYAPGSEQTQVTFWNLYKDTFSKYPEYAMLSAADIIRNVTVHFPEANASVVHGTNQRFVIQNLRRKRKPSPIGRLKCQWKRPEDSETCLSEAYNSPEELAAHITTTHVESSPHPLKCHWISCPYTPSPPSTFALNRHILTHLPSPTPPAKHRSQPSGFTSSPGTVAPVVATSLFEPASNLRPIPPPPSPIVTYLRAVPSNSVPHISLLAIYTLRILFWSAFPTGDAAAAPVADEERFGFPSLPSMRTQGDRGNTSDEKLKEAEMGMDVKEAERRGRKTFRSARHLMEEVYISDEVIMGWVVDMIVRTYNVNDEGDEEDRLVGGLESNTDMEE
ncbi:uncharacterized protein EI90DRAFT_3124396 [Cantharellus anzutake]|uniref:uncharacterized protein n=1 Tax=Cantharellus anzutake TaxID=1750568 RepID=UPI0019081F8E|nr:uncharacterized protein EI90DRAFT_3124396 [Cantharellus anzutake]KAF8330363.1 hypothetical protein EI90DRAFT_3124396 [Cantharellus anzutake]